MVILYKIWKIMARLKLVKIACAHIQNGCFVFLGVIVCKIQAKDYLCYNWITDNCNP